MDGWISLNKTNKRVQAWTAFRANLNTSDMDIAIISESHLKCIIDIRLSYCNSRIFSLQIRQDQNWVLIERKVVWQSMSMKILRSVHTRRQVVATISPHVYFMQKLLPLQQNFVAATCRMKSNWLDLNQCTLKGHVT